LVNRWRQMSHSRRRLCWSWDLVIMVERLESRGNYGLRLMAYGLWLTAALKVEMPKNARRHRPPRRPLLRDLVEPSRIRSATSESQAPRRFCQGKIAVGPDVGPAQCHQEVDVDTPGAEATNFKQPLAAGFVVRAGNCPEVEIPRHEPERELVAVRRFL